MGQAIEVTRIDRSAGELRQEASRCGNGRVACRILAIAHVLDGASRSEAAAACGMDRQSARLGASLQRGWHFRFIRCAAQRPTCGAIAWPITGLEAAGSRWAEVAQGSNAFGVGMATGGQTRSVTVWSAGAVLISALKLRYVTR